MVKKYFIGKISDYSKRKGWFFGHFMDEESLKSNIVEVAFQHVPDKKVSPEDWHYHKKGIEINILLSGTAHFKIDGKDVQIKPEEFWVVYPGTVIEDFATEGDVKIIVIRAPSIPGDKVLKENG